MLDDNTNKITWVAVAIGVTALVGASAMALYPSAMTSMTKNVTTLTQQFTTQDTPDPVMSLEKSESFGVFSAKTNYPDSYTAITLPKTTGYATYFNSTKDLYNAPSNKYVAISDIPKLQAVSKLDAGAKVKSNMLYIYTANDTSKQTLVKTDLATAKMSLDATTEYSVGFLVSKLSTDDLQQEMVNVVMSGAEIQSLNDRFGMFVQYGDTLSDYLKNPSFKSSFEIIQTQNYNTRFPTNSYATYQSFNPDVTVDKEYIDNIYNNAASQASLQITTLQANAILGNMDDIHRHQELFKSLNQ